MTIDSPDLTVQLEWPATQVPRPRWRRLGAGLTLAERRFLLRAVDLLVLNSALVVAVMVWDDFPRSGAALMAHFKWFATLSAVWLILATALDVYNLVRSASTVQSVLYAGLAALMTGMLYLAIPWLTPPLGRRLLAVSFVALATLGIATWRALYAQLFFQPAFQRRVLVVGGRNASRRLVHELRDAAAVEAANPFRGTGYVVTGFVEDMEVDRAPASDGVRPVFVPEQDLVHWARRLGIDEILVDDEQDLSPALREAIMDCRELGLQVIPLSVAYERLTARLPVEYACQDLSLIAGATESPSVRLQEAVKRMMDISIGLVGVLLVAILSPLIALANALASPGPLFYRQHRVGQGGRPFALIKFRTMVTTAEDGVGAVWAKSDDQRVTRVGRWLRRTRLDELPQFINVLRGEMTVVGPRPERPQFVGEIVHHLPIYRARHALRPGITGWAQVCYRYGGSVEDARIKLEYDLYYLKHASFFLDLLILLQTPVVMVTARGH